MLHTSTLINLQKDIIMLKRINNFFIFLFNFTNKHYVKKKYSDILKKYYTYTFITFYLRIIWRGKAYRVRLFKKNQKFTLNFGHSHWCKLWYNINFFKFFKIKRQNYVVLFNSRWDDFYLKFLFTKIRIYNKYTRRGIKLKKTPYVRRFGKISQVNSSLHSY